MATGCTCWNIYADSPANMPTLSRSIREEGRSSSSPSSSSRSSNTDSSHGRIRRNNSRVTDSMQQRPRRQSRRLSRAEQTHRHSTVVRHSDILRECLSRRRMGHVDGHAARILSRITVKTKNIAIRLSGKSSDSQNKRVLESCNHFVLVFMFQ